MNLSIIIPSYNEGKTIGKVLKKLLLLKIASITKEIIVVDDGSSDNTLNEIEKLNSKEVKVIAHKKNLGKGEAVKTGIKNATGDYILIQDADLEYDPSFIPSLVEPILDKKTEVVYGTRLKRMPNLKKDEKETLFLIHYFGNRFLSLLTSLLYGQFITDMETGYKLFLKKSIDGIKLNSRSFDFEPEITSKLLKKGYKILEVPIRTVPRNYAEGKKLNTVRDGAIAFWTLLKYRFVD